VCVCLACLYSREHIPLVPITDVSRVVFHPLVCSVTVTHDGSTCGGASYLASLTESLQAGMVLTLSLVRSLASLWASAPSLAITVAFGGTRATWPGVA
jgi:hypothetical protein